MRVIAIFDWVSQFFLNCISEEIYSMLRKIRSDRTFSQDPQFSHIQASRKQKFHSLDLTAATDRFPLAVQKQVMTLLYGKTVSDSWGITMVGQEFYTPEGNKIRYSVGQPMGARSS